jgi:uncharacterized membrane protein
MLQYIKWILLNIALPLLPFLIKIYILVVGKEGIINIETIFELPEIIFYSIYICIINLNINFSGEKGIYEFFLRIFFYTIIFMDSINLGMIYSNNSGSNMYISSIIFTLVPMLIAPIYKFFFIRLERSEDDDF